VDAEEADKRARYGSAKRSRLVEFAVLVVVSILVLRLIGAPSILILEMFGLAVILGISAVLLILVFGRKTRLR
jgi:hypothetical protein